MRWHLSAACAVLYLAALVGSMGAASGAFGHKWEAQGRGWFVSVVLAGVIGLAAALLGCAFSSIRERANCRRRCEGDACVHYCRDQETVTRRCAKNATMTDAGHKIDSDGTFFDPRTGQRREIKACLEYLPYYPLSEADKASGNPPKANPYPFSIWLWEQEAWRRSHEDCHAAVFRRGGRRADHDKCDRFGYDRSGPGAGTGPGKVEYP